MSAGVTVVNVHIPSATSAPIIADFVEHALRVSYISRRDVEKLADNDWNDPGVYVLQTGDGSGKIYVGKATRLRQRIFDHRSSPRLEWVRAVLIKRDTSDGFTSADIGYLEGRLSAELDAVDSLTVVKGKTDKDSTLSRHMMASLDALLPSMVAAVRLSGVDVFKDADLPETGDSSGLADKRNVASIPGSVANLLGAGLLQAGSSLHLTRGGRREQATVTGDGEIIVNGVAYASPSRAAKEAIGGMAANGWEDWRVGSPAGPTLSTLRSQFNADVRTK
jgi:hypothetical protein